MLKRQLHQRCSMRIGEGSQRSDNARCTIFLHSPQNRLDVIGVIDLDERQRDAKLARCALQFTADLGEGATTTADDREA
jgi:hypothetical protein